MRVFFTLVLSLFFAGAAAQAGDPPAHLLDLRIEPSFWLKRAADLNNEVKTALDQYQGDYRIFLQSDEHGTPARLKVYKEGSLLPFQNFEIQNEKFVGNLLEEKTQGRYSLEMLFQKAADGKTYELYLIPDRSEDAEDLVILTLRKSDSGEWQVEDTSPRRVSRLNVTIGLKDIDLELAALLQASRESSLLNFSDSSLRPARESNAPRKQISPSQELRSSPLPSRDSQAERI